MIHETAIIDPSARLHDSVEVGPWTLIGANVDVGEGTKIESHVVVKGPTRIGARNHIYQFSSVGEATPDLKYRDEPTELQIGDDNVIRENVTIHRGTVQDRSLTEIGDRNLLMAYVHVGHDSVIGNDTILVNNTALAGHVEVGDWTILSGYTLVHQFCKIGPHSFSGMGTSIGKDAPAFGVSIVRQEAIGPHQAARRLAPTFRIVCRCGPRPDQCQNRKQESRQPAHTETPFARNWPHGAA